MPDPAHTLAEMARCAARHVLVSVPREPLWRAVNMARGAYWRELGNTPGHVNHFSKSAIVVALRAPRRRDRDALAVPLDDGACPRLSDGPSARRRIEMGSDRSGRSYASGARMLSIGIASTGVLTLAYFAIASHLLHGHGGEYSHLDVLWSVMFVIISVIYRPIEQLLSRTIADHHARGITALPMRVPVTIQSVFALAFLAVALPLHDELAHHVVRLRHAVLDLRRRHRRLRSELLRARLAGRPPLLRALRRPRLHGVDLADRLRDRGGGRHHPRAVGDRRSASRRRRSSRWSSCRRRSQAGRHAQERQPPATDAALEGPAAEGIEEVVSDLSIRRGGGFAIAVSGIQLSSRRC